MIHSFEALIDDLRSTLGVNLRAVILYGSAAAGDFVPNRSDYNLLIALDKITPADLRNSHPVIREWTRMGQPSPVFFTVSELQNAADVFPIEFHQMEDARRVLYGTDVLADIVISDKFLRHQTEFELRSKLIKLRGNYINVANSPEGLAKLMSDSLSSFAALFRAVLMLKGIRSAAKKHAIVDTTANALGLEKRVFDTIFDIRENSHNGGLDTLAANRLMSEYMEQIEKVIDVIDKMENR